MRHSPDIEQTFVQLLVGHQAALNAYVYSMLPGSSDADDVVQEVNALVWKKRGEFEIGTNFKQWIFSIAKFQVMALWRDRKRNKVWALPEDTLTKLMDEASDFCADGKDYRQDALKECIQQLSQKDRSLILSHYMQGNSMKEVADAVGRNAQNLKGSMHRIRLNLRSCVVSKMHVWKVTT